MVGTPQIFIQVTPEQFEQILDDRLDKALSKYFSEFASDLKESDLPEMATPKQVCEYLKLTRQTLAIWSKDSNEGPAKLVPLRFGRAVRYRRQDVLKAGKEYRRFKE
ncbi:helix-turn-helix transcriptional regulator [Spirosoma foliorum]|uniref:Helix-turn-helix domain-containing protein n=1 Tax=Spirosoma foliorum TaxID=2710596 RepID=A0A7G5GUD2_9BACT|nr:helix-turn-helix domain-containing protein [Spirosoma foliorum]QMW02474.1 helix-turn-helix domain-containing protein [Spirosoma foliorum]